MEGALPVGMLATLLREWLEGDPRLADLWVEGEVGNRFLARRAISIFRCATATANSNACFSVDRRCASQ